MTRPQRIERIYVAAPWAHRGTARFVRDELVGRGYTVTSRWLDFVGDSADPDVQATEATNDYNDVFSADCLLLLNLSKSAGGMHVETGLALAWRIPVVIVGERSNVFHHMPGVEVWPTVDQALEVIGGMGR